MAGLLAVSAPAAEMMPAAQQNVLVQKYCAVCHTDPANNGGLSLQHFDAAQAPPSLTAMLLSKLTGGVSLDTLKQARLNPAAAELVETKMKSGAMGAAGIPVPDKATVEAFIQALAMESAGLADFMDEVAITPDYEQAAWANYRCRRNGIAGSSSDFLICAVAIRRGWPIFTPDRDFHHYARVLPIRLFDPRRPYER